MMRIASFLLSSLLLFPALACKQQGNQGATPNPVGAASSGDFYDQLNRLDQDHLDDQQRIKNEQTTRQEQLRALNNRIDELNSQIKGSQKQKIQDTANMQAEIDRLKSEREEIQRQIDSFATKSSSTPSASTAGSTSTLGVSGFPFCGDRYYGTEWACNGKQCAKSDRDYKNSCEITATSKKGYPACGTTTYGLIFDCDGKRCAKSDPDTKNICELP